MNRSHRNWVVRGLRVVAVGRQPAANVMMHRIYYGFPSTDGSGRGWT